MVISPAETGHRIQRLRIANGLNQAQLAAATMIPTGGVSMVEHGRQGLDEATLDVYKRQQVTGSARGTWPSGGRRGEFSAYFRYVVRT